jgi:hypothetical protein
MKNNPSRKMTTDPYQPESDFPPERQIIAQDLPLPKQVAAEQSAAEKIETWIRNSIRNRGGRPRARVKHNVFVGDSLEELDAALFAHATAIGKKTRGNRRIGEAAFYADLIQSAIEMRRAGIRPPKGGSLSRWACDAKFRLGEILRKHNKISEKQMKALEINSEVRLEIGKKLRRQFTRISNELSK